VVLGAGRSGTMLTAAKERGGAFQTWRSNKPLGKNLSCNLKLQRTTDVDVTKKVNTFCKKVERRIEGQKVNDLPRHSHGRKKGRDAQ